MERLSLIDDIQKHIEDSIRKIQDKLDYDFVIECFNNGKIPRYNYSVDYNDDYTGLKWTRKEEKVTSLVEQKTVDTTPIFKLVDRTYQSEQQGTFHRSVVEMNSDAVAFMLYDIPTGKFYTNSEFRSGINRDAVSIPAGKINEDESPVEALYREAKEETGYDLTKIGGLVVSKVATVNSSEGFTNEKTTVYVVLGEFSEVKVDEKDFDDDEFMTGGFYFTPQSLFTHLNELEISAPFHIALLHFKLGDI